MLAKDTFFGLILKKVVVILIFLMFLSHRSTAQYTQTVLGTVLDKQSEMPLIGANIILIDTSLVLGTITDENGYFNLEGVPIGRQSFLVSYLGYLPITLSNLEITKGKQVILSITLEESVQDLTAVIVSAGAVKDKAQNEFSTISARTFSVEEVMKYSGGRNDVARLAANFAGVGTANDSRNDIVIRGNSPVGVLWRLEGIPIPNPNHFSTLGTTGGIVSALNSNLLKNSDFLTSAFSAEYGNALAGIFDLSFRSGNRVKHEFMLQAGAFSGLEVMAEGPLSKKKQKSYLVSGRYSFVGLAHRFNLNIGTNATPDYSDLAFKIDLGKTKLGQLLLFGVGGFSDVSLSHEEVGDDDLFVNKDEDSFANSSFGVVGLKNNILINDNTYIRNVLGVSISGNEFDQYRVFNIDTTTEYRLKYFETNNFEYRITFSSFINKKFNAKWTLRSGILLENFQNNLSARDRNNRPDLDGDGDPDFFTVYDFKGSIMLAQAFSQVQFKPSNRWTINGGLHSQYLFLNSTFALEPRLALNYKLTKKHTISLGYGMHHQTSPLPVLLLEKEVSAGVFERTNESLDFTRAHHFVLGYDIKPWQNWRVKLEVYYQLLNNVPIEPTPSSFSILTLGTDFGFPVDKFSLQNDGVGNNKGIELTIEKFFHQNYYGMLTASLFDSKYKGSDQIARNTPFNNKFVVNLLGGKEFKLGSQNRFKLTFDTKLTVAGGRFYTPVDLEASQLYETEILDNNLAFSERYNTYFRWDMKLGFKLNGKVRDIYYHIFLDFQNVTNMDNIFVKRYNRVSGQVENTYQLGFIPDFMFRIQF